MKSRKITKVVVASLLATMVTTGMAKGAVNVGTTNTSNKTENVLKVDIADDGSVTYSVDGTAEEEKKFSWDNATVYFVLTDRFNNGDTSNDHSYGRGLDQNGNVQDGYENNPGAFQGGDLKGLTDKLKDGYFSELGVNAIWLTAPYEQIHGYTSGNAAGGNGENNGKGFPYYSYHGYWALDYTNIDENMGNEEDFKEFVDTAHSQGIRVVMDIVLNHVGYTTMKDADEYGFGGLVNGWEDYYYGPLSALSGGTVESNTWYDKDSSNWAIKWWGSDFLRVSAGYAGYPKVNEGGGYTDSLCGLPDIKTESTQEVGLPAILETKWKREGRYEQEMAELDEFFAKRNLARTPRNYVIKWLTDYIRDFGIDGFRCDTASQVDMASWAALNEEANIAFEEYKANNPDKVLDPDAEFWTTAESWGHGVGKSAYFTEGGFSSIINFTFKGASTSNMKAKYNELQKVNNDDDFNVLSYISSHDDLLHDRNSLIDGGTALLLAPGAVQIFYGDETARPVGWSDFFNQGDYLDQRYRTFMNWDDLSNPNSQAALTLAHWQKVGQFRNNHLSVGAGEHNDISNSPYTFSRTYSKDGYNDKVVCVVGASGTVDVDVSSVFSNGSLVRDAYTGNTARVENGIARFTADPNGVILIEKGDKSPDVAVSPSSREYYTDTLELKLSVSNVATGTYSVDGVSMGTFKNGDKIEVGNGLNFDSTTQVTVSAENEDGTATATYTYTKRDPEKMRVKVHYYNENSWANPYAYIYDESGTEAKEVAAWPGVKMENEGNGWYSYNQIGWLEAQVIFSNAGASQNPGQSQPGFEISGEMWYKGGTWYTSNPDGPTIKTFTIDNSEGNKNILLSAEATGEGELQYKFEVTKDGVTDTISEFSTVNEVRWTPQEAGTFVLKVTVKDSSGATSETTKNFVIEKEKLVINKISLSIQEVKVGDNVTINISATGDGSLEYKFSTHEIKSGWKNLSSSYSNDNSITWTPDTSGRYTIWVDVKDEAGNKESKSIDVKVIE